MPALVILVALAGAVIVARAIADPVVATSGLVAILSRLVLVVVGVTWQMGRRRS